MKVCFFLPSLAGGGAERAMLRVASGLAARGHGVQLVTARDDRAPTNQPGTEVGYRSLGKRHVRSAIAPLATNLRTTRPDVLVTAMDHGNVAGLAARGLSRTGVPVVVTFHTDVASASRGSRNLYSSVRPLVARTIVRRADHVVAVSEGARDSLLALAPERRARVTTIYNPVLDDDLLALAQRPVEDLDVEPGRSVLAVGRLAYVKGFDILIRAFARVCSDNPELELLILGEGPERSHLERLAVELQVAERVHLPGFVTNPYASMARCRVLAFSSRWEGMPTVLVEAGALGCTIVATDCRSGPRELLGHRAQATLVPVDDVDALAAGLRDALLRPGPHPPGDWSAHTADECVRRYEQVLRTVA